MSKLWPEKGKWELVYFNLNYILCLLENPNVDLVFQVK